MKQTSVEFLKRMVFPYLTHEQKMLTGQFFEQAKEMYKQEIIQAWEDGDHAYFYSRISESKEDFVNGEQYYNEKFNYDTKRES